MSTLNEEVVSLKESLTNAQDQVNQLEQQLTSHAEVHQATLEALEKQAETLQVSDSITCDYKHCMRQHAFCTRLSCKTPFVGLHERQSVRLGHAGCAQ